MLSIILGLALVGFIVWLIVTYIPMPAPFQTIIIAFVAICLIIWLLGAVGVGGLSVPRLR